MYRTRRVTPRRIEAALAELRGEEPDAAGGGKQEARRDGLIAAADFAVYLREFGSICGRSALLLATMASFAASISGTATSLDRHRDLPCSPITLNNYYYNMTLKGSL